MSKEHTPRDGQGDVVDGGPVVLGEDRMTTAELDELFEVLADRQRRRIVGYLVDEEVAEFSQLVDHVVATAAEESTDDHRERVTVRLHHTHLPRLDDAGIVEYDTRSETVRFRGGDGVTQWIELARSYERAVDDA